VLGYVWEGVPVHVHPRLRWPVLVSLVLPFTLGSLLLPGVLRAAPVTRHVSSCADSGGASLRGTIAAAAAGDSIVFDLDCTIALGATLTIPATLDLSISALSPAHAVTLDGGNSVQILHLQASNNQGPTVSLNGLTFRNGKSAAAGGAIFNDQGNLTVTNSTFLNNSAVTGGGAIENAGGTLAVTNSTFFNNSVTGTSVATGGAIDNNAFSKATITSSTLSGNKVSSTAASSSAGGGIFTFAGAANGLTLAGNIVAGNTGGNCGGTDVASASPAVTSGGRNVIGVSASGACGQDFTLSGGSGDKVGSAGTPLDAKLGDLGSYGGKTQTIPLLPGSPAIDAGACASGVTTDQRGIARPQGGSCDAGAFESQGVQTLAVAVTAGGPMTLKVGQTGQFTATGTFDGGGTADISTQVTWSSDATTILTVDSGGKATGVAPGVANVVAKMGDVTGKAGVTVTAGTPVGVAPQPAPGSRPGGATVPGATPQSAPSPRAGSGSGSGNQPAVGGNATATPAATPVPAPSARSGGSGTATAVRGADNATATATVAATATPTATATATGTKPGGSAASAPSSR
jgi:Bacterial Ig-like domain (group 2)